MCAEWVADPHTRPDVGPLVEGVSPPTCALERRWGRHLHGTTQVPNSLEGQLHVTCVVLCSLRRMVAAQQRERRLVEHARAHNIAIVLSGERLRQGGGGVPGVTLDGTHHTHHVCGVPTCPRGTARNTFFVRTSTRLSSGSTLPWLTLQPLRTPAARPQPSPAHHTCSRRDRPVTLPLDFRRWCDVHMSTCKRPPDCHGLLTHHWMRQPHNRHQGETATGTVFIPAFHPLHNPTTHTFRPDPISTVTV